MRRFLLIAIAALLVVPTEAGWRDGWRKKKTPDAADADPSPEASAAPAFDDDEEIPFSDPGESVSEATKPKAVPPSGNKASHAVVDDDEEEHFNRRLSDLSQTSSPKAKSKTATPPRQRVPTPAELAREEKRA